jgi:rare lipoprotein A
VRFRVGLRYFRRRALPLLVGPTLAACASSPAPPASTKQGAPEPRRGKTEVARPSVRRPAREPLGIEVSDSAVAEMKAFLRPALSTATGEATYYADKFDGRRTASGIVFRNSRPYAAHRTYPFGTMLRVTNVANKRWVIVRVVDRGPHGTSARARRTIIDLSRSVAERLGFVRAGRTAVRVEVLEWGDGRTSWPRK